MTPRQQDLLKFVSDFIAQKGFSPTIREISVGLGKTPTSKGSVAAMIDRLVKQGLLSKPDDRTPRGLTVQKLPDGHKCPACGRVAA